MTSSAPAPARQQELRNFLNGAFAGTQDGAVTSIVDPSTGEAYAQAPLSDAADVDAALRAAATAFETWRDTTRPSGACRPTASTTTPASSTS